ncbi:MAG: Gfo/Idh/MocA family protein [Hyphomicrobiaceae bacterium]
MQTSNTDTSNPWKALVVGCGKVGSQLNSATTDTDVLTHALAYIRHPDFALTAGVDPDAENRKDFSRRWGVATVYGSLDEALASDSYDIVSLASPTSSHLEQLERLTSVDLRAVYCEKPVGGDVETARPLVRQFADRKVPVAVNFQRRWDREMVALKSEIASGEWGEVCSVVGRYCRGVVNNASHMLDLVSYLTDLSAHAVAVHRTLFDGVDGDPTVDATLTLSNGAPLHLIGLDGRHYAIFELELFCTNGSIAIEDFGFFVRRRKASLGAWHEHVVSREDGARVATSYGSAMLDALDEIRNWTHGKALSSDTSSAFESLACAETLRSLAMANQVKDRS